MKNILYAITHSLYSGRARSYLIKNHIPFEERSTGHESYKAEVLPLAQLPTIPTLVTAEGKVIRDGAAIIEHFESMNGGANQPLGPRQRVLSALFDVLGTDGLLRPAMHYRWNFPEDNLEFIRFHFVYSQRDLPDRDEKTEAMMNRMRHAAQFFGVTDATAPLVESLYLDYLLALNAHFATYPYLLGWRPCVGDFGLLGPMYAHLARDPHPARLMQQRAVRVFRWVERMNRADQDVPEFFNAETDYLPDDQVPETLLRVLRCLAEDFVPETRAATTTINAWLKAHTPEPGSPAVGRVVHTIGAAEFSVRGTTLSGLAQPHRFYLLQRVQATYESLTAAEQASVEHMLLACGMEDILALKLDRRIGRADNLEVWL
jgi:glutathione S-transferase